MTEQKKYNTDGKTSEDRALDILADMKNERIKSMRRQDGWKKHGYRQKLASLPRETCKSESSMTA